jgi:Tol biopolymer transport system component
MRRLDTGQVTRISDAGDFAGQPFFSPNGRWIGFFSPGGPGRVRLRKVPVDGGLAVDLAELSEYPMGASWGPDGRIYLGSGEQGLQWVPAEGGSPRRITTADRTRESGHRLPRVLPDSDAIVFTTMPLAFGVKARIEAFSPGSGERKVVVEDGADARYLPTGHLAFMQQGVLMAAPFDRSRLELTAPPVPVTEGVSQALGDAGDANWNSGAGQFAVSDSGLLAYASGRIHERPPIELLLLDESGRLEPLPGFDRPLVTPQGDFSPDGRYLAFVESPPGGLLWLFDLRRQTYRALTNSGHAVCPQWSPDGTRLVASWTEGGPIHLWSVPTGRGDRKRLTESEHNDLAPSWSPDGQFLVFVRGYPGPEDIFLYRFDDGQTLPFLVTQARESHPEFSPDGRWLAYDSDESGRPEVYVTSFPDREQTLTVSRRGGVAPSWSPDGRRLFYYPPSPASDGSRSMMSVAVRHSPELSLGQPIPLFRLPDGFVHLYPMRGYDLHPDGRRFLIGRLMKTDPLPPITRLHIVHNWFAELERLAPTDR